MDEALAKAVRKGELRRVVGAPVPYPAPPPETHPYSDPGTELTILGTIVAGGGWYATTDCTEVYTLTGTCASYPYISLGQALIGVGIVMTVAGIVLMFVTKPEASQQPVYPVQVVTYAQPGGPTAAAAVSAERYCPVCGGVNPRAARFCNRCGRALPPPPR